MKLPLFFTIIVLSASMLIAGNPPEGAKSTPSFDKLKSLVGTWKGKDSQGKPVSISYKIVSAGTSIMETLDMEEHPEAMITMYHLDGNKVMMTHYCSLGNQPRMRAKELSKDAKVLSFNFVDVSNLSSAKDNYMHKLVLTFTDDDHFSQEWSMRMEGKMDHPEKFEFERVK